MSTELFVDVPVLSHGATEPDIRPNRGVLVYTLLSILLLLWLIGLAAHFGGNFIHLLLVVAVILFIVQRLTGRASV
jgi:hypothetical protein